jgi:hypothetical protein
MSVCTGLTAVWCPVHGDCVCPREDNGDILSMDDALCPLHSPRSEHPSKRRRIAIRRRGRST